MELIFEFIIAFIGQIISELLLTLIITPIYFLIIKPVLILLGFVSFLIEKALKKNIKSLNKTSFNELEKSGIAFIRASLVLILLFLLVGMMVYFAFYVF